MSRLSFIVVLAVACNSPTPAGAPAAPQPAPPAPAATPSTSPSQPVPVALHEYPGPLGLKWGMTPSEVKGILAGKLTLSTEKDFKPVAYYRQEWNGPFAGRPTDAIDVTFCDGGLSGVTVFPASADPQHFFVRWQLIVAETKGQYGEPSAEATPHRLPTAESSQLDRDIGLSEMADRIVNGEDLIAIWDFAKDVSIAVRAIAPPSDAHGGRTVRLVWEFMTPKDGECQKRFAATRAKDF